MSHFEEKKAKLINKWVGDDWIAWNSYFWPQWTSGWFIYWQIWNTPPGSSTGNNPIESVNKQIKDCFTKYESLSVINLLNVICRDLIVYYSYNKHAISLVPNLPSANCKDNVLIQLEKKLVHAQFQVYPYLPNTILYSDCSVSNKVLIDIHRYRETLVYVLVLYRLGNLPSPVACF
jgi:hypothetical protein